MPEPVRITFGDRVRVQTTSATEAAAVAGLTGVVYGETTPSITKVAVIGLLEYDHAINVHFKNLNQAYWFAPHLLEFVDHGPGAEIQLKGIDKKWVRSADGEWHDEAITKPNRPWWRFW